TDHRCSSRSVLLAIAMLFFLQAGDGIRSFHVTGVQTCALPISLAGTWAGTDPFLALAVPAAVGGIAGMLLDSLLGATVQERFRCPVCQRETEAPVHRCGTPTQRVGGWRGVNNDVVNFCATLAGALVAAGMHRVLGGL